MALSHGTALRLQVQQYCCRLLFKSDSLSCLSGHAALIMVQAPCRNHCGPLRLYYIIYISMEFVKSKFSSFYRPGAPSRRIFSPHAGKKSKFVSLNKKSAAFPPPFRRCRDFSPCGASRHRRKGQKEKKKMPCREKTRQKKIDNGSVL